MAIDKINDKLIGDYINKFINDELLLDKYTKIEDIVNTDYNVQDTIKIGKRINKNLEYILQSEQGIEEFSKLLYNDNSFIRFITARFLYPVFPNTSIKIMTEYKDTEKNSFEKHNIDNIIKGLETKQPIFMDQFKKLYNTDNLEELNRESQEKCK